MRTQLQALVDELSASLGCNNDFVPKFHERLAKVLQRIRFVVGDSDSQIHTSVLRKVIRSSAPRPTAMSPPWASTTRLAIIPR